MKVKAFTFMELLVVMALTALVVGISYSAYAIVLKQQKIYQESGVTISEIELLNTTLYKDIQQVKSVEQVANQLFLFPFDGSRLSYYFYEDYIYRNINDKTDTFWVSDVNLVTTTLENSTIVNQIQLQLNWNEEEYNLFINKKYGADTYLSITK